jgi:hypothetical protein
LIHQGSMTVGIPSIRILGPQRVRWTPESLAPSIQDMRMKLGLLLLLKSFHKLGPPARQAKYGKGWAI